MFNPIRRLVNNPVIKAIGLEIIGNEAFALFRGGDKQVPEKGGGDSPETGTPGAGAQLQTGHSWFTRKDESAFAQAYGTLCRIDPMAASSLEERISGYLPWDRSILRVVIALYADEERRVEVLQNWGNMGDEEWNATEKYLGVKRVQSYWALTKKAYRCAEDLDAEVARKMRESREPRSIVEGFDFPPEDEDLTFPPDDFEPGFTTSSASSTVEKKGGCLGPVLVGLVIAIVLVVLLFWAP